MAPIFSLAIRKIENHNIINEYSFLVKITKLKEKKHQNIKKKKMQEEIVMSIRQLIILGIFQIMIYQVL